jgi:hypothetical protein
LCTPILPAVETYVHFRWVWLTLPGALIVASAAFLVLPMLETTRKKAEAWKDPRMALTFHGLEQDGVSTARVNKISHMELVARGVKGYIGANGRRKLEAFRSR